MAEKVRIPPWFQHLEDEPVPDPEEDEEAYERWMIQRETDEYWNHQPMAVYDP